MEICAINLRRKGNTGESKEVGKGERRTGFFSLLRILAGTVWLLGTTVFPIAGKQQNGAPVRAPHGCGCRSSTRYHTTPSDAKYMQMSVTMMGSTTESQK